MVGRMRYALPLSPSLAAKFDALDDELDVRVLGSSGGGNGADPRFALAAPVRPRALDGAAFYALLPFRVARELRRFRPGRSPRPGRPGDGAHARRAGTRPRADASRRRCPR